jgi:hypothetical protein
MTKITWENITVRLGDLKPWAVNPRYSTKAQAERLLQSFKEFGQVQTVAVGPGLEVYDGHQRLSALMTVHGADYVLDARQSNRELSDDERKKLVITLHAGAVGAWDWDTISGWDAPKLIEWGFDAAALREWNSDANNLRELINSELPANGDSEDLWEGMPEFKQDNIDDAVKTILVHFANSNDIKLFSDLICQCVNMNTRYIWYPKKQNADLKLLVSHGES